MNQPLTRVLVCGWMLMTLAGCGGFLGYSTQETFDLEVGTVSVPIFENKTFDRGLEMQLTEALIKEIEFRTPYKTVTGKGKADTMIQGTILSVERRLLSRVYDVGVAQEVQVVVTATIAWKDLRTGKVLRERRLQGTGEFVPTRPVGEPYEVARRVAVSEISREIVSAMRSGW